MVSQYQEALSRSAEYEFLSLAFLYPKAGALTNLVQGVEQLKETASKLGNTELKAVLDKLADQLALIDDRGFEEEYIHVFGHTISNDCAPYECEYGQSSLFQKSGTLSDLSSFYAAFGVKQNPELKDRVDHISVEMEFMQLLTAKEAHADLQGHGEDKVLLCREAQAAFLTKHLANWVNAFAHRLAAKAGCNGIYGPFAHLLEIHMERELRLFAVDAPADRSPDEPEEDDLECGAPSPPISAINTILEGN